MSNQLMAVLGPISITAARCVAWRCVALKRFNALRIAIVTIARHATQRAAVMEMGL